MGESNLSDTNTNDTKSPDNSLEKIFCWYHDNEGNALTLTVIFTFLPLALLATCSIYSQVRRDNFVPVYIISLLISDIIQIICMVTVVAHVWNLQVELSIAIHIYEGAVIASVFYMTLIALERYLMIAQPLWYRFRRPVKVSVLFSVVTWVLSLISPFVSHGYLAALFLFPFPLLIFFLVRTLRALSAAQSVPPDEKRQIVAVLVVVLLIYTVMFLPRILMDIEYWLFGGSEHSMYAILLKVSCILIQVSPLTDLLLYFVVRKWIFEKLLSVLFCWIKNRNATQQERVTTITR